MKFYSIAQVSAMLNVSAHSVRRYITEGLKNRRLVAHRIGGTGDWRVEEADLRAFMGMGPEHEKPEPLPGSETDIDVVAARVIAKFGYKGPRGRKSPMPLGRGRLPFETGRIKDATSPEATS